MKKITKKRQAEDYEEDELSELIEDKIERIKNENKEVNP